MLKVELGGASNYPVVNIQKAMENGPFIVDLRGFTDKHGDFPWLFVCLPEATWQKHHGDDNPNNDLGRAC